MLYYKACISKQNGKINSKIVTTLYYDWQLQDLLLSYMGSEECKKNADEGGTQFDPRSAIFVANKWELVPQKEREEVKEMIYSQLGEIWTGLSKSQVFFLSAKQVRLRHKLSS